MTGFAFQVGPFQLDFQQGIPGPPPPGPPGQFPIQNYVGLDWYVASYNIFRAGLIQQDPPNLVPIGNFVLEQPGTVLAQVPVAGTYITPGGTVHLTVATENLLSVTFQVN